MAKFVEGMTKKQVINEYKSCAVIKKVDGGWMVFETLYDYCVWENQK